MDKLGSLTYSRDVINSLYETLRSMVCNDIYFFHYYTFHVVIKLYSINADI